MKNVDLNLKPVTGKKLPLKVKTTINYDDLKKKSNRKAFTPRPVFLRLRRICVLLYPDGKEALFLPGIYYH